MVDKMRCSGYCIASSLDMPKLFDFIKNLYDVKRYREVIHIKIVAQDPQEGDVFVFPYASLVCWGLSEEQEKSIIDILTKFVEQLSNKFCFDEFTYEYGHKPNIVEDEIIVPNKETLTKLAFAHGIAQSVKLDSFEKTIYHTVDLTRALPQDMARKGKINLSGKEIQRMMGRLIIDRHSINLHQELLDTPEFFWEYSELESIYKLTAHYLDLQSRVHVLNQRLTVLKEMFEMLNNQYNHKHASNLELTIVILIVIEVALALAKDIFHII